VTGFSNSVIASSIRVSVVSPVSASAAAKIGSKNGTKSKLCCFRDMPMPFRISAMPASASPRRHFIHPW
jgi:hypothetical protein